MQSTRVDYLRDGKNNIISCRLCVALFVGEMVLKQGHPHQTDKMPMMAN